ncbi:MAG: DUF5340 domain-containing protein [Oscillatoriales cyanobacterium SM2_2_1]|nr:DUF5340 domain-containing protein [Oscillatoriales cyanobacterium SM2_2_1]
MDPLPVPSHIHYELLLQLLERQTMPVLQSLTENGRQGAAWRQSRECIHGAIISLRKALVLQKQCEEFFESQGVPVSYRWSLNETGVDEETLGKIED